MKAENVAQIERLEAKLASPDKIETAILPLVNGGLQTLFSLESMYNDSRIDVKRELIGSMFPEKLTFDGKDLRTTRINEVAELFT